MSKRAAHRRERLKMVERWKRSGLSPSEFAKEAGVTTETLRKWRLRATELERRRQPAPGFVEVKMPPSREDRALAEIALANGRRVRILAGFETDELQRLIRVVESC